jgi:two-component system, LytTR family, sensor histidine kinase LytS
MSELLINLLGRLGIFTIVFFFIMRFRSVKNLLTGKATRREKIYFSIIFGLFGIAGTYMGVPTHNAIANSRVVGVALGGILGGPVVGFFSGIIAGGHRLLMDIHGFSSLACGIATVFEGLIGGFLYRKLKRRSFDPYAALLTGLSVECVQMVLILIFAKPFEEAVNLISIIALPMITVNALGLALFVELISSRSKEQERVGAMQAQTALNIALKTLPFLRSGLTEKTATETAKIIYDMTDLDAVAITDDTKILAHKGVGEDHHLLGNTILTNATQLALAEGEIMTPLSKEEIGCINSNCSLTSAIIVPLKRGSKTIGLLKLYRAKNKEMRRLDTELAHGLAHLFSNQLELAEMENLRKLSNDAEIKALQAQINPHFLFNTITTIMSYTRSDPKVAYDLLLKLSDFFRKNIKPGDKIVSLSTEIKHCEAYIGIEKARFEERIKVVYDIEPEAMECMIPPLTLQPLVENALGHGILPKENGGKITIGAHKIDNMINIYVKDDGVGMSESTRNDLFAEEHDNGKKEGTGIAIKNVNARLIAIFGADHSLAVESAPDQGTKISFSVPCA